MPGWTPLATPCARSSTRTRRASSSTMSPGSKAGWRAAPGLLHGRVQPPYQRLFPRPDRRLVFQPLARHDARDAAGRRRYVVVMQQQTCDTLIQNLVDNPDDPSCRLMDVGQRLNLRPLQGDDVRRLVEWPMRNHLGYTRRSSIRSHLDWRESFPDPGFLHNLVMHMARQQRQQVAPEDLETVRNEFMQPQDHTFAHMTEMLKEIGNHVAGVLARLATESAWGGQLGTPPRGAARRGARQPADQPAPAHSTGCAGAAGPGQVALSSLLFQQWLAINAYAVSTTPGIVR